MATLLFSYGTLQNKDVQLAHFGRELTGRPDTLTGYGRRLVPILDPAEIASTGETHYANAELAPGETVTGTVYEVTEEELAAADEYEEPALYNRIIVTLASGTAAWVYVRRSLE
jgi:gamma-glutamylcyclotransferase (GGCT)/AIG2-like uncharacterized protein YtfP